MIDMNAELQKYKPVDLDGEIEHESDLSQLLNIFTKAVEKIGREQYKYHKNIDEIL